MVRVMLRTAAETNSKMAWFNVSTIGLTGRHHPVLNGAVTAHEVKKLRPMVRMLAGDYFCFAVKNDQSGGGDHCRLCPDLGPDLPRPREDVQHIVTECEATRQTRERVMTSLRSCVESMNMDPRAIHELFNDNVVLCQFILDCSSLNLANHIRMNISDARLTEVVKICRDICYAIHNDRLRQLKMLTLERPGSG